MFNEYSGSWKRLDLYFGNDNRKIRVKTDHAQQA